MTCALAPGRGALRRYGRADVEDVGADGLQHGLREAARHPLRDQNRGFQRERLTGHFLAGKRPDLPAEVVKYYGKTWYCPIAAVVIRMLKRQ